MNSLLTKVLFDQTYDTDWHMSLAERSAMLQILNHIRPEVSIEIGTYHGGSLRPISRLSKKVFTFDIDPNQHRIGSMFPNVEFITGNSRVTLPPLIESLNNTGANLQFILVDGSHDEDDVRVDLAHCLRFVPKQRPLVILMHDSWNPSVRKGIIEAPWRQCAHAHVLELDFVSGVLFDRADIRNQIWGGLAVGILLPEPRQGEFVIEAGFEYSRSVLITRSIYL